MSSPKEFSIRQVIGVAALLGATLAIATPYLMRDGHGSRQAVTVQTVKALASATLLYASDSDDALPCGTTPDVRHPGEIKFRPRVSASQNPAGWFAAKEIVAEDRLVWNNVIARYLKPGSSAGSPYRVVDIGDQPWLDSYHSARFAPVGMNLTYNGYLQYLTLSSLDTASVPMFWQGLGDIARAGAATANPRLNCNGVGPCRFALSGPQAWSTGLPSVIDVVLDSVNYTPIGGRSNLFVTADGAARPVYFGRGNQLSGRDSLDSLSPFKSLNDDGTLLQGVLRGCRIRGKAGYVAAFLPFGKANCQTDGSDTLQATEIRISESGR